MNLDRLVEAIEQLDIDLRKQSIKVVSASLTIRNWLIGWHIAEYELKGDDRAVYGEHLLETLSERLISLGMTNCNQRQLYRYRRLYQIYP